MNFAIPVRQLDASFVVSIATLIQHQCVMTDDRARSVNLCFMANRLAEHFDFSCDAITNFGLEAVDQDWTNTRSENFVFHLVCDDTWASTRLRLMGFESNRRVFK